MVQSLVDHPKSQGRRSNDRQTTHEVGASLGIVDNAITTINKDISKLIFVHLKPRMIKLSELIRRVSGMRRSTTSILHPKYCRATRTFCSSNTQSNKKFCLRLKSQALGSWIRVLHTMWPLTDPNFGNIQPILWLTLSQKFAALCYKRNRHHRPQPSRWLYINTT